MSGVNKFLTFLTILIFMHLSETPFAEQNQQCVPSSCGHIHDISYPFRLKSDPKHCGHENYELSCEGNRTILSTLYNDVSDYYVVQAINYDNSPIRLVDPGIREQVVCSLPHSVYSLPIGFGTYSRRYLPGDGGFPIEYFSLVETITIFSCPFAINSSVIVEITSCLNRSYASNASSDLFMRHTYATMVKNFPTDLSVGCSIDLLPLTSWHTEDANANISILSLHNALAYGFELSWFSYVYCGKCYNSNQVCVGENSGVVRCVDNPDTCNNYDFRYFKSVYCVPSRRVLSVLTRIVPWMLPITGVIVAVMLLPCIFVFLMVKLRRRHLSIFDAIESFLHSESNFMPIRYPYSNIRKMTRNFEEKLGQGGFGSVYKGKALKWS